MFRWISENYRTFLWAFVLAVAVWVSAVTSADPNETRSLPSSIPIEIVGQDPGLVLNGGLPNSVDLTLRAPRSIWNRIEADPTLLRAILDLSGLSAGEHTIDLQIQVEARPVQILSVAPHEITFTLEPLISQTLEVDLSIAGEAAVGFKVGEPILTPLEIVVAGAQSDVQKVTRARISINLNRTREDIDQTYFVDVLDDNGQKVEGITVSPDTIHVNLTVSQEGGYRDVAVKVVTAGQVAIGYRLTDITVFPPVVTVYATDPDVVNNLPGILETQILDLRNAKEDISTRLALNLPQGVSVIGEQTVSIQAGVSPIESSITLAEEKVEIIGLGNGLTAEVSPLNVDVIVSGPLPLLDKLTRQDVRVTVDLSGLEIGKHQVSPQVEALISDIIVESLLPNTIEVIISLAGAPTVRPTP